MFEISLDHVHVPGEIRIVHILDGLRPGNSTYEQPSKRVAFAKLKNTGTFRGPIARKESNKFVLVKMEEHILSKESKTKGKVTDNEKKRTGRGNDKERRRKGRGKDR